MQHTWYSKKTVYVIHQVLLTRKKNTHISTAATSTNNFHTLSIYNPKLPIIIATADSTMEWYYFLKNIQDIEMHKTCNKGSHCKDQQTLLWVS
jgi:hypothetical protein